MDGVKINQKLRKFLINWILIYRYKKDVKVKIEKLMTFKSNNVFKHKPTLLEEKTDEFVEMLKISFYTRQKKMKEGMIAELMISNFIGWSKLKSGLDVVKKDNSIVIEIKNNYNTCNSNSEKSVIRKLYHYKKSNKDTRLVLGIINPKSEKLKDTYKIIKYKNTVIEKIQGRKLLKLVFTLDNIDYSYYIIKYIKSILKDF